MSSLHDQLAQIERTGAAAFSTTSLAHNHSSITRTVRRHRTARGAVSAFAGVGVVGAGSWGAMTAFTGDSPLAPGVSATSSATAPPSLGPLPDCDMAQAALGDAATASYPNGEVPAEVLCHITDGDRVAIITTMEGSLVPLTLRGDAAMGLAAATDVANARIGEPCFWSGYLTVAEQQTATDPNGELLSAEAAAARGTGLAFDLCLSDTDYYDAFAGIVAQFGWSRPVAAEPWHFEYTPARVTPGTDLVTFVTGQTSTQIAAKLAEAYDIDEARALAAIEASVDRLAPEATSIEGWVTDGTVDLSRSLSVEDAADAIVATRVQQLTDLGIPRAEWQTVITKASMVEREAPLAVDKPKVARVIENRLALDMKLELESTVKFVAPGDGVFTTDEDRAKQSPYNTYLNTGLPPGAIATPSLESIQAVVSPAEGDWLFFVTGNLETGEMLYASTFMDHQENVRVLTEWISANS